MSLSEPRLAWSVAFVPSAFLPVDAPAWPSLITEVAGNVTAPTVDPVTHILHGPIPRAALARGVTDAGLHFVVGGVGSGITLTLTDHLDGEVDALDLGAMRARLASALLGLEVPAKGEPAGEMAATPDRLGALLAERFADEPGWRFVGLVEVSAVLQEGVASTLPDGDGWVDQGDLRIGRATGIGAGHAAWTLSGYWTTKTQRTVLDRRLTVLLKGHLNRMSAFAQYGSHALVWGEAARSAMRCSCERPAVQRGASPSRVRCAMPPCRPPPRRAACSSTVTSTPCRRWCLEMGSMSCASSCAMPRRARWTTGWQPSARTCKHAASSSMPPACLPSADTPTRGPSRP